MILQSLRDYYERLVDDQESGIPEPGFCVQGIHFCLVLNDNGDLLGAPIDLRTDSFAKQLIVPQAVKRSSGIAANFLWDNTGYVLGSGTEGVTQRTQQRFGAFKKLNHEIGDGMKDTGMKAVLKFLDNWSPTNAPSLTYWEDMAGLNIVFKLEGETEYIHERPELKKAWMNYIANKGDELRGMCLVTGESNVQISRLHPAIKGVSGAQSSGAALISFNLQSFTSYGKNQNYNAPVGETAAFAYTTALNRLLSKNSRQKVQIGDTSTVFWTEKESPAESIMAGLFDPGILKDAPDTLQNEIKVFLESITKGEFPKSLGEPKNRFYILGLSPNAARISVRFWHASTVDEVAKKVGRHYQDLSIIKNYDSDPEYPALWQILRETAAQRDSRNIAPALSGQIMRSILTGSPYPQTLLVSIIARMRADKQVNYLRASVLKAILIRNFNMEVTMSLNTESVSIGYRLGRLFAVMEKAQEEAVSGANATIKDRFFGAASATPGRVFPFLMRGVQNSISKLRKGPDGRGRAVYFDRLISEITDEIDQFPTALRLEDQGLFVIGYYHQRKDLFTKKTDQDQKEG